MDRNTNINCLKGEISCEEFDEKEIAVIFQTISRYALVVVITPFLTSQLLLYYGGSLLRQWWER